MAEDRGNLLSIDGATLIFVKKAEGCMHVGLVKELLLVDGCGAPFAEVNGIVTINVSDVEDLIRTFIDLHGVLSGV